MKTCPYYKQGMFSVVKFENFIRKKWIFSSPEPLGSQGELIGWP